LTFDPVLYIANTMSAMTNNRLAQLGVPVAYHPGVAARRAPRFHTVIHFTIILASLVAATAAMAGWSHYIDATAEESARSMHALLYDSDIGAESLGIILTALFAAGWLCGAITWRRGSESARNGWGADLMHEPMKNKAIIDWLWRRLIRRHTVGSASADDFLDLLGAGVVRDLRLATLVMIALTAMFGAMAPARISYATASAIADHPVLPWAREVVRPMASATGIITGCPTLPKDGSTLVYELRFADGAEVNLGTWRPLTVSRLSALESVSSQLSAAIPRERFTNPIGTCPLTADCLQAFGDDQGPEDITRLLTLLAVSPAEKKALPALP
jgi:hypothetical protein